MNKSFITLSLRDNPRAKVWGQRHLEGLDLTFSTEDLISLYSEFRKVASLQGYCFTSASGQSKYLTSSRSQMRLGSTSSRTSAHNNKKSTGSRTRIEMRSNEALTLQVSPCLLGGAKKL
jgi:hypothetical protein